MIGSVEALRFEPTLIQIRRMAEHYDLTILPTRSHKPRHKGKIDSS
ncbi:hypothetical protein [Mesorhizobium sp.]|nr:hypothetical protein [Mesorhizobium sp.]